MAQHALLVHHQADQLARAAGGLLRFQRGATDEAARLSIGIRIQRHGPAQRGFKRRDLLVHVLAVQVHAGFQAQGVARAEPGRLHARGKQGIPERDGLCLRHDHLEAVLAGVAGAGDEHLDPIGGLRGARGEAQQLGDRRAVLLAQQADHLVARGRALHRDHAELRALAHGDIEGLRLFADPRQVLVAGGRVHHQAEPVLGHEIDDQVVDHPALRVEHAGVQRLARLLQLVDVVRHQVAQEFTDAGAGEVDHGHVRDVEHAGRLAHQVVLVELRTVVDRHVPAAEIDHLRAERAVGLVEDGLLGHRDACLRGAGIIPRRGILRMRHHVGAPPRAGDLHMLAVAEPGRIRPARPAGSSHRRRRSALPHRSAGRARSPPSRRRRSARGRGHRRSPAPAAPPGRPVPQCGG